MRRLVYLLTLALAVSGCPSDEQEGEKPAEEAKPEEVEKVEPKLAQLTEVEPNEKTDQAMELKEGCTVSASLEAAAGPKKRALDWYKISPAGKSLVKIRAAGVADEDLDLYFMDSDKNKLFTVNSGGSGQGEGFPNLTVDGSVYLRVRGAEGGQGGAYSLTVEMTAPVDGDEVESNDRYSSASPLEVGGKTSGFLGHRRDEDWYLLSTKDLPTGSVLRIDLTDVADVRFGLEVLDQAERSPIMKTNSVELGKGVVVRNLGLEGSPEAVYLVVKSAWVPGDQPKKFVQTFNSDVKYSLSVSSEAGGDDLEREPNDDATHAFKMLDGQKIRGYLSSPNDVDWYKIEVERPSILSAELSALARVDLQLYVVDPEKKDQKKGFELIRLNDGELNEPEVLTNCALKPGENYIRVEGAWKNVDGKWVRDFMNLDETYELIVNLKTDEGKQEREPNNKVEQATVINPGDTLRGTVHPKRDRDYYKLDLSEQAGPRNTLIECTGIPKLDITIMLQGPEKDDKGNLREVAKSAKGKGEQKEQIQKELMPGEYHIQVIGRPRSESNTRDQYLLTVTQP